jgi:hypothetical protein
MPNMSLGVGWAYWARDPSMRTRVGLWPRPARFCLVSRWPNELYIFMGWARMRVQPFLFLCWQMAAVEHELCLFYAF